MRKKQKNSGFNDFGMPKLNMPFIPNLADFINEGQSGLNPLESGVRRVTKATSMGFDYDERESTKNIRKKRRDDLFDRGQRLNSGEAPLSDFEIYQYDRGVDYMGGQNRPPRNQRFGLF